MKLLKENLQMINFQPERMGSPTFTGCTELNSVVSTFKQITSTCAGLVHASPRSRTWSSESTDSIDKSDGRAMIAYDSQIRAFTPTLQQMKNQLALFNTSMPSNKINGSLDLRKEAPTPTPTPPLPLVRQRTSSTEADTAFILGEGLAFDLDSTTERPYAIELLTNIKG